MNTYLLSGWGSRYEKGGFALPVRTTSDPPASGMVSFKNATSKNAYAFDESLGTMAV
ncbi:MAG: hypothetical protein AAF483_22825 [Planctomycetota bacterium]